MYLYRWVVHIDERASYIAQGLDAREREREISDTRLGVSNTHQRECVPSNSCRHLPSR